jgi:hypothetical protein
VREMEPASLATNVLLVDCELNREMVGSIVNSEAHIGQDTSIFGPQEAMGVCEHAGETDEKSGILHDHHYSPLPVSNASSPDV